MKNPDWEGWVIIDKMDNSKLNAPSLELNKLEDLAIEFYRERYWNRINGNEIKDQQIATELFDIAINMGKITAVKYLQRTLNILNRNQRYYKDIKVDGIIGPITLSTLDKSNFMNDGELVFNVLNFYQAKNYIEIMERSKDQEEFIGWFGRIKIRRDK